MSRRLRVADAMSMYFLEKGKIMTYHDYVKEKDGPFSMSALKRSTGGWTRMIAICDRAFPDRMREVRGGVPPVRIVTPIEVSEPAVPASKLLSEAEGIVTAAEALAKLKVATSEI